MPICTNRIARTQSQSEIIMAWNEIIMPCGGINGVLESVLRGPVWLRSDELRRLHNTRNQKEIESPWFLLLD